MNHNHTDVKYALPYGGENENKRDPKVRTILHTDAKYALHMEGRMRTGETQMYEP